MTPLLSDQFTAVAAVRDVHEFRREVVKFAKHLGFNTVTAGGVVDQVDGSARFAFVDNAPEAYLELYMDEEGGKRDPVMQHCKHSSMPIIWDQETYVRGGQASKWESQAAHGYRTGISLALHLPRGLHFYIGVDRDQALPSDSQEISRLTADLHLFLIHAHDVGLKLLCEGVRRDRGGPPQLTPRELEALRWTTEGKTAWEVGQILTISEQTAVRHLNNAARKLECASKHHAAIKALRLGLIL